MSKTSLYTLVGKVANQNTDLNNINQRLISLLHDIDTNNKQPSNTSSTHGGSPTNGLLPDINHWIDQNDQLIKELYVMTDALHDYLSRGDNSNAVTSESYKDPQKDTHISEHILHTN